MIRLRERARPSNSLLRLAIRQVSAGPFLTGSLLFGMTPAAHAISLGDIGVRSTLGQKLDATVQVHLGPGETLASGCIEPGTGASDLRRAPGVAVTTPQATGEGIFELRVTSASALYEPMYALELTAQCPGAPGLVRQYVLMLDLPAATLATMNPATEPGASAEPSAQTPVAPAKVVPVRTAVPRVPTRPVGATIQAGARYRVAEGDTLSSIAARVRSRTVSLWALADAIQAANPDAFIRNDPDLISLGSEILIPGAAAADSATSIPIAPAGPTAASAPTPLPVEEIAPPAAPIAAPAVSVVATEAPVVRAPVPVPAPVQPGAKAPPVAVAPVKATDATDADEPNPVVAAAAGIFFGLSISTLLWFLGRRPSRKPRPAEPTGESEAKPAFNATPLAAAPAAPEGRPSDTGFSVYYTPPQDDALAAEFADELEPTVIGPPAKAPATAAIASNADITAELEELFNSTDTAIQKRLNAEKTVAARSLGSSPAIDKDASEPVGSSAVDFLVGDPTSEEATLAGETVEQPRPHRRTTGDNGTLDLQSLTAAATKDQDQAQTLLEALTLLQRDYEDELTASQVLEQSAVRAILGKELDEPTQIHEPEARKAAPRAKSG